MAHIKCRYTLPFCTEFDDIRVSHSYFWFCDEISDQCPDGRRYKRPKNADSIIGNPQCVYCKYKSGEFEKTVKKYEYYDGVLRVAGDTFYANEIDYLEIDGRVLVEPQESEESCDNCKHNTESWDSDACDGCCGANSKWSGEIYPGEFEAMEHNGRLDALESEEISREEIAALLARESEDKE